MNAKIIKDTLPLTQMVSQDTAKLCKKHGIPVFKGKLFKHEGPMNQNLDDWGEPIFTHVADNTVVLGGAVLALSYLFGKNPHSEGIYLPPSLNDIHSVNNDPSLYSDLRSTVKLFGVGTGGASAERFGDVYDPSFTQSELVDWIPFRTSDTTTLSADDAGKYHFRKQFSSAPSVQYGWYLKDFENTSNLTITSRWKDTVDATGTGAEINSVDDISNHDTTTNLIETYAECQLKITEDDIRGYFEFNQDLTMARYNTIGLFTGAYNETVADYVDVHLFSVVNMDNVSVKIPTETTYLYRVYAAV